MSQVARTTAAGSQAAASTSVSRLPASARAVASFEPTPVDELSPKIGVSYEETEYFFQEFGDDRGGGAEGQRRPPLGIPSLMRTSSEAFASLVDFLVNVPDSPSAAGTNRVSPFGIALSTAIDAYEAMARAAGESAAPRGGMFSFQL